jgi:RNA polymerase sigma-70 factor (ECF subfamily)
MELCWTIEMTRVPGPPCEADEARLVAASRGGDRGAFSDLVRVHQRRVFRLASRFFRQREDVEDAAQDTFLTAWRKLDTYRAKAPFEHWLTRVCLNCCYARLRRPRPAEQPLDREIAAHVADPDARLEVERLLRPLKPEERFILILLDGEGWSVADIAQRLGWTRVNVKVRAHRARKKLRRLLEREERT